MAASGEINELIAEAETSERDERQQHAAFLYEGARRLAHERGESARAFRLGVLAATCWNRAGEYERGLETILQLLVEVPSDVNPIDVYDARKEQLWHAIDSAHDMASIRAILAEINNLYSTLNPGGPDTAFFEGYLLQKQGRFDEAYNCYEIAWSRHKTSHVSMSSYTFASRCALMAIRLDRMNEAERWISRIHSDFWQHDARLHRLAAQMQLGLRARDPLAVRRALTDLDEAMSGVQRPRYVATIIDLAVSGLCLDLEHGDPQKPTHPASRRLADFPRREFQFLKGRESWTRAVLTHRLASLRYASGMPPDEDFFGRPPQVLSAHFETAIPDEIPARTTAARVASDEAMAVAHQLDGQFKSDWRQVEVANLGQRIENIAAIHGT
jgi:tetratricopeptide (TPR) repeat protein